MKFLSVTSTFRSIVTFSGDVFCLACEGIHNIYRYDSSRFLITITFISISFFCLREKAIIAAFEKKQNVLIKHGVESYEPQDIGRVVLIERRKPIDFFPMNKLHQELMKKSKKRGWKLNPASWFGKKGKRIPSLTKTSPRLVKIWNEWPSIVDDDIDWRYSGVDVMDREPSLSSKSSESTSRVTNLRIVSFEEDRNGELVKDLLASPKIDAKMAIVSQDPLSAHSAASKLVRSMFSTGEFCV